MKANTTKKRILVFIDWYLPGYKAGGPVRSMANMTAHLSDTLDFYIVTRNSEYGEVAPFEGIQPDRWTDLAPGVKVWYCSAGTPSVGLWKRLIKESRCEVVYINGIYSPLFSLLPLLAAKLLKFKRVIVAPRGMLGRGALEIKAFKKKAFLALVKVAGLYKGVVWHVTAESERFEVQEVIGSMATTVLLPNLAKPAYNEVGVSTIEKVKGKLRLCYLSRVSRKKNLLYALDVLSTLDSKVVVDYDIYGPVDDKVYWERCQKRIAQLPGNINVSYNSFVEPDQISLMFNIYHALFLPTRHENFGHVILESFMAGRPVVISDQTPWRNLTEKQAGWDLPLADQAAFAETLTRLAVMGQDEYDQWCNGAWAQGAACSNDASLLAQYKVLFTGNSER